MTEGRPDFEIWYRDVHPRLGTSLALAFGDVSLAQEAADEACARALERWPRVAHRQSPSRWVYRVAFNVARRRLRRAGLERRLLMNHRDEVVDPPAGELWTVVAERAPRQRQAVVLRHVAQLREAEIADVMGVSSGTVSSTLRSAYKSLRESLADPPEAP